MQLADIIKKQEEGYTWSIGGEKATLRKVLKTKTISIVSRKVSPKFQRIAIMSGIDCFCFNIFGPNGRSWWKYHRFLEIVS